MDYLLKPMLSEDSPIRVVERKTFGKSLDHLDFHPHYEMYFCPQTIAQCVAVNGEVRVIDVPNVIITSPYSVHLMLPKDYDVERFERHVVYFDENLFHWVNSELFPQGIFSEERNTAFYLTEDDASYLLDIARQWYREGISHEEQGLYFSAFLLALNRCVPPERREMLDRTRSEIPSILSFINRNLDGDLSFHRITREFGISRAKLDRDFRKTVGNSLHQTVINCRVSAAVRMLKQTDLPIQEIALACGFESEYYFYSFFKRNTGMTPNSLRKNKCEK